MQASKNRTKALTWNPTGEDFKSLNDAEDYAVHKKQVEEWEAAGGVGEFKRDAIYRHAIQHPVNWQISAPIGGRIVIVACSDMTGANARGRLIGGGRKYAVVLTDDNAVNVAYWSEVMPEEWFDMLPDDMGNRLGRIDSHEIGESIDAAGAALYSDLSNAEVWSAIAPRLLELCGKMWTPAPGQSKPEKQK